MANCCGNINVKSLEDVFGGGIPKKVDLLQNQFV